MAQTALCKQEQQFEDEKPPPLNKKMKDFPPQSPTCLDLNPQSLKRARHSCKAESADPVQTPLENPPVKKEPTASPAPAPISPSTDPPKSRSLRLTAKKDVNPVCFSSVVKASVPYSCPQNVNKSIQTKVPLVCTNSPIGPGQEPFKPSPPLEATVDTKQEDLDSFFLSLVKKSRLAPSEASGNATTPAIDPPPTTKEIELAKNTFRCLLRLSFRDILCKSETFAETINTLVRYQALGHDLYQALQLFKDAFPSLSQTYDSTRQRKFKVDNRLRQADIHTAKLNQGIVCYQKLKTDEEDAQAKKKAVKDQISMLQLRLSQLDDKLTDLSSEKEVLYQIMKDERIAYEKLEGELPSLYCTKSKLEAELADTEKVWVNFRSRFGSL
ncbi:uncharacterized protein LOC131307553 isoform X2 [Rhododendron vialii]|uniref:uncharacterized protein LOC131307553 isoform X2 n=1 Tax=Rhododendron vialii TaxID=182163 RepID=UPI00265F4434|nr:uncharacterized protein LOC131307553 isoform X2 [Rhododendron vialii]